MFGVLVKGDFFVFRMVLVDLIFFFFWFYRLLFCFVFWEFDVYGLYVKVYLFFDIKLVLISGRY